MKYYTYIYVISAIKNDKNYISVGTLSARNNAEALGFAITLFEDNNPNSTIVKHSVKLITSIPDYAFIENGMLVYEV